MAIGFFKKGVLELKYIDDVSLMEYIYIASYKQMICKCCNSHEHVFSHVSTKRLV